MINSFMKVVSFDIFNTLLQFSCGNEEQMFRILGYNILGDKTNIINISEFIRIRKSGELKAHKQTEEEEEITTKDIYDNCDFTALTDMPNESIMNKEFSLVPTLLMPIWENIQILNRFRSKGYKVLFISDMHLPTYVIRKCLEKWNLIKSESDELFVSSEYKKTKNKGTLYFQVKKTLNIKTKEWIHYGDNYISDYKMAKAFGINAKITKKSHNLYYTYRAIKNETEFIERPIKLISSITQSYCSSLQKSQYRTLIADIIAPLYISHVYQILFDAHKQNIKQLLFFARDSYMFYIIAKELNCLFPEITLKYIYVSRRTLYLPSIEKICTAEFIRLKDIKHLSVSDYLDQFGIDIMKLPFCPKVEENSPKETLNRILSDQKNINSIEKIQEESTTNLLNYLLQQIDNFDQTAMVDMTGSRSSQEAINKLLVKSNFKPIPAYYFFVSEDRKSIKDAGVFKATLLSDFMHFGSFKCIGDLILLFEDVFSITNQERTIAYKKYNENIIPSFDQLPIQEKIARTKAMESNINTFIEISKLYVTCKAYLCNNEILKSSIINIGEFSINPLFRYVKELKRFSISENSAQKTKIILYPWNKDFKKSWFRGSIVSLSPFSNLFISLAIFLKNKFKKNI